MDWDTIIERNRGRILLAIAPLLAVLGFDPRRRGEMPRHFHRALIALLRPAESAVRRLIIIAARGIVLKLRLAAGRAFPKGLVLNRDAERIPAFCLIDPLKRFAPEGFEWAKEWGKEWDKEQVLPRISVPGLFDPVFPGPVPIPLRDDPVDAAALVRRIQALKTALEQSAARGQAAGALEGAGRTGAQGRSSQAVPPHALPPRLRPGLPPA